MEPYLAEKFANPSGVHALARGAKRALDDARDEVAAVFGCEPSEVVFTSGGTESDNLAVTGAALHAVAAGAERAIVCCSATEHPAVLEPVRFLGGVEVPVHTSGVLDVGALEAVLRVEQSGVVLVSIMLANNETGVMQPLAEIAELVADAAPTALVHSDAVQALRWVDVSRCAPVDLVSATGHKIGGPKGAGVLIVRGDARRRLSPILRGGPQERELRAGTPNVPAIVGLATAARLAAAEREEACVRVSRLAGRLLAGIRSIVPDADLAGDGAPRLPSVVNVGLPGIGSEEMLLVLDQLGVAASAGSACASGALEPSPVLLAMGLSGAVARTHVRFSLAPTTAEHEIDGAVQAVAEAVGRLRAA